jgi:hypothetical protein
MYVRFVRIAAVRRAGLLLRLEAQFGRDGGWVEPSGPGSAAAPMPRA